MKAYHSIPKVLAHNRWRVQDISAPRRVHHTRPVLFLRRHPNPKANNMPPLRHQILFRHFVKSCVFLQVLPLRRFSALPPLSRLSETIKVQSAYLFLSRHSPERQAQSLNRAQFRIAFRIHRASPHSNRIRRQTLCAFWVTEYSDYHFDRVW